MQGKENGEKESKKRNFEEVKIKIKVKISFLFTASHSLYLF